MPKRSVTAFSLSVLLFMILCAISVFAAQGPAAATVDSVAAHPPLQLNQSFDPFGTLFKTVALLLFMSLLLYVALRMYRGYLQARGARADAHRVQVLSTTMVAPRKSVCIMQALDHVLVVGMADNQMNVLLDVPMSELNDDLRMSLFEDKTASGPGFSQHLQQWMKRQG
jgi:flagellar biogenesis protein FliO